jgi:hypothetical protein
MLRRWRKSALVFVCSASLVVAGCQNGGLDLQKALVTGFDTYSFQSAETVTLQLELNEQALAKLPKEEQQFYRTFQEVSLTFADHIRVGRNLESVVGMLEFVGGTIPFIYTRNGLSSAFYVEGAKKSIVFNDDARFKLDQITVTEDEIGPAPAGISKEKKSTWSPQFSAVYSGAAMPSGITTSGWLPGGTMVFKSSDYDRWRSKRIDEIRVQKKQALQAKDQIAKPGYGQWVVDLKGTLEKANSAIESLAFYVVRNTPLPQATALDEVVIEIAGQQEQLKRLRVQADGSALGGMLSGMLQGFANNNNELRIVAESLYDLTSAYNASRLENLREIDPDSEETVALRQYLGDRKAMIDSLYGELKSTVDESLASSDVWIPNEAELDFEFYYQGSTGRAASLQLYVPFASSNGSPLKGIAISYAMQRWNVGKELPIQTIDTSIGKLDYFQKDGSYPFASPFELLQFFDEESTAHALLEAFDVGGIDVDFPLAPGTLQEGEKAGLAGARAYSENGVTLVPLRFASEQLYTDVKWNGKKQEITITDAASGRVIVLIIGNRSAYVDGKPIQMQVAPLISPSGKTYVPIRFIAETLGAEVKWNHEQQRVGVRK